jgi:ubiquinone/menaquinone biosynthesis C-methylase UbiE
MARHADVHPGTAAPNHHAGIGDFSGLRGTVLALVMTVGRGDDAQLAGGLTNLRKGDDVVDVGCGPGAAARWAGRAGAHVIGVDPAAPMLRTARRMTRPRHGDIRYVEGVAEALPVPDASADVVWALATVHHWPDVEAGIAEAHRVLRPGGRFLAIEKLTKAGATGIASHGWTEEQADTFAELCRTAGFAGARVERDPARRRPTIAVVATRP